MKPPVKVDGISIVPTLRGKADRQRRHKYLYWQYGSAAKPEHSEPLYEQFCDLLAARLGTPVGRGRFGAMMDVSLINDGPVTIVIDSKARE